MINYIIHIHIIIIIIIYLHKKLLLK